MGVYGDGGASQRAADAAAAEAARQAEIERQRLADEATAAKAEADRRAAEEAARQQAQLDQQKKDAEDLRNQIAAQNAATLAAQQKIEDERKAERDADLARAEKERQDAAAAAGAKAAALTEYNTGRQTAVDAARAKIQDAFTPFDDSYYAKYSKDYTDYYTPQVDQQYDDAKRGATFSFANKGSLDSTAAARAFGRLGQENTTARANIGQQAVSAANGLRSSVDAQKADLLNSVFGAVNAAPVVTADNVGDANSSLAALTNALSSPVSLASSAASSVAPPAFGQLGSIFALPGSGAAAPKTTFGGAGGTSSYGTTKSSSGRLVS